MGFHLFLPYHLLEECSSGNYVLKHSLRQINSQLDMGRESGTAFSKTWRARGKKIQAELGKGTSSNAQQMF